MTIKHVWAIMILALALILPMARGSAPAKVILEQVLSIGGPDEDLLFLWTGVSVDRDDNVFLIDTLDYSVKKFDSRGRFLKKAGRKGQGPGEFEKALGVAVAEEAVYAWDLNARAIQVYDRNLVYRKSFPTPGFVDTVIPRSDGSLAVGLRASTGLMKIVILSAEGRILREIGFSGPDAPGLTDSISIAIGPAGGYYLGHLFRDLVERRNADGERIWGKAPWGVKSIASEDVKGLKVPTESCVLSVARDSQGRLFVLGGKKAENPGRAVLVFNADGSTAAGFALPEPSHSLYFDHRDFLYVAADGGVTMKKYRVIFK